MTTGDSRAFFAEQHTRLYGERKPYRWQEELFDRFVRGEIPPVIDLPTGTGKTTVMFLWYTALAWMTHSYTPILLPLRLFWIVNRRVVVDQATELAERIQKSDKILNIAISTLRGQLADNGEWKQNPTRPAIIIGTVDMIGSKLLFSGYGDGPYWRSQHAGLAGVDSLFINDEAHLTPAFARLCRDIERLRPAAKIPGKDFRFCALSATPLSGAESPFPQNLEADLLVPHFKSRVTAPKHLHLHSHTDKRKADATFQELAFEEAAPRVVVFHEKPEDASNLFGKLNEKYPARVALLTGTMRGAERDQILGDSEKPLSAAAQVFRQFLDPEPPAQTIWLVATSAAEVGVDLTCERQISMLVEADHLVQRFGRLNRFAAPSGDAHIVFTAPSDKEPRKAATLLWLQTLPDVAGAKDICALTLYRHPAPEKARTPEPPLAKLDQWLLELWSQTTGKAKYPEVKHWLHGKDEHVPQTAIAWRFETDDLTNAVRKQWIEVVDLREAFDCFPLLPREILTEPSQRVRMKLAKLAADRPDVSVLVRQRDGSVDLETLNSVVQERYELEEVTIILPLSVGRLNDGGMFEAAFDDTADGDSAKDVANGASSSGLRRRFQSTEAAPPRGEKVLLRLDLFGEDSEERAYFYYCCERPSQRNQAAARKYLLSDHLDEVSDKAASFARILIPELEATYKKAGHAHDEGKAREIWQNAMGRCRDAIVAKPFAIPKPKQLGGYRHELGTLAKLKADASESDFSELALHLIAAHHGHARPFFHDRSHDSTHLRASQDVINETPGRFARLSTEWGLWGLAYLEAILKSADGLISNEADANYDTEGQVGDDAT